MLRDKEAADPLVSVVIPTRNRPEMACRAVRSALRQTYPNLEVVVVVDGPDPSTVKALAQLHEPRLRVLPLRDNVGGGEARNIGAREARGEWIALLDDDDEWLVEKVQRQMIVARGLESTNAFIACSFIDRSATSDRTAPSRMPDPREPIDEYLFCPKGYRTGEGFLQTSTLLVHRNLLMQVPFVTGLKRGQETTWMLRACAQAQANYHVMLDVLSVFNNRDDTPRRVSSSPKWRSFYDWVRENRSCFSPKSYSFCIATAVLPDAIKSNEPFAIKLQLLWECFHNGAPTPKCMVKFIYALLLPRPVRSMLSEVSRVMPEDARGLNRMRQLVDGTRT